MSLLAPLYIAGVLTVALPILFHLIRRTPQKRQTFSSLMFLSQSPPRLTRRSRLTNILLLILRAAALTLLAIAFARPFFFARADMNLNTAQGKRIAILVDTSASMRRGDLWQQARKQVDQVLADVAPADEVALYLFDRSVHPAFTFEQWNSVESSRRTPLLEARLADASPTWAATNLGLALATVADQLSESQGAKANTDLPRREIVLVSDLQQGGHMEALQGHEWPQGVMLDVKPVAVSQSTNASLQWVREQPDAPDAAPDRLRVRVSNQPGASSEQFTVSWANAQGPLPAIAPQKLYVPAGRSQVIKLTWPPADQQAERLVLQGDDFDFDNTLYLVQPQQQTARVVFIGDDAANDPKGLSYYLRSTLTDGPREKFEYVDRTPARLADDDLTDARLVVASAALPDDRLPALRHFAEAGGTVLWVMKDATSLAGAVSLGQLDGLTATESKDASFALISRVNLDNPLFSAFAADPRFADFSKIHFWKHRQVRPTEAVKAIAWFDDGDPFLLEKTLGKGRLIIATSGWQPADSQLALSTRFVPLIGGLFHRRDTDLSNAQFVVGDELPIPREPPGPWTLHTPGGSEIPAAGAATDQPGIYRLTAPQRQLSFAVNVAPDESRTVPVLAGDLEQWGAHVGTEPAPEVLVAKQRQLKLAELENRQKMWRWLLIGVLGLLAAETILAGRLARRDFAIPTSAPQQVTT